MPTSSQSSGKDLTPTANLVIKRRQIANGVDVRHRILLFAHYFFPPIGTTAPSAWGPPYCRSFTITLRHTTLGGSPLDEWSARRRIPSLHDNTQHSEETDTSIHTTGFESQSQQESGLWYQRFAWYVVGSKSFRPDQLFKVTEIKQLCYFST